MPAAKEHGWSSKAPQDTESGIRMYWRKQEASPFLPNLQHFQAGSESFSSQSSAFPSILWRRVLPLSDMQTLSFTQCAQSNFTIIEWGYNRILFVWSYSSTKNESMPPYTPGETTKMIIFNDSALHKKCEHWHRVIV